MDKLLTVNSMLSWASFSASPFYRVFLYLKMF